MQDKSKKLDDAGVQRFRKDLKLVEESIEKAKDLERQKAADSHMRLKSHMDNKDKQREELIQTLNIEAKEAKDRLTKI